MSQFEQPTANTSDPEGSIFLPKKDYEDLRTWRSRNELAIMLGRGSVMTHMNKNDDGYYDKQQELITQLKHQYDDMLAQEAS